jgi:hypothetical protein
MRYVWLAAAFMLTLVVGLLVGITLESGGETTEQGSAPAPRTVTVEKTVPARTTPNPTTTIAPSTAPAQNVGSLDDARAAFERAVEGYGNPNLEVAEVMEFANNYYAEVTEKDTGIGAMELLINRPGSRVYPEPGPNMMWNTKYGMMGGNGMGGQGMMGPGGQGMMQPDDSGRGPIMGPSGQGMMGPGGQGMMDGGSPQTSPETEMPVSPEQATQVAEDYLNRVSPGTETEEPDQFYGYYTLHTLQDGEVTGMLSVNGYTGQVWYHGWHGPFIAMEEEGESH